MRGWDKEAAPAELKLAEEGTRAAVGGIEGAAGGAARGEEKGAGSAAEAVHEGRPRRPARRNTC